MFVPFEHLSPNARVWVYQTNRQLTSQEATYILQYLQIQAEQWAAHGSALMASVRIEHLRFVILAVDERLNQASGCSIDASANWFKTLGQELGLDFFDRSITFLHQGEISSVAMPQVKASINNGLIRPDTLIFNNLVNTVSQWESQWKIPAVDSWMKRFFEV
jgi:hypothetical protein